MYIEEIKFIPVIPEDILLTAEQAMQNENVYQGRATPDVYGSFLPNQELEDWVQQFYDYEVATRYQVIGRDLPIHVDHGIVGTKANYIITSGGPNVVTQWWDSKDNPTTMLHQEHCETKKWYDLNIEEPHCVINLTETRFSVTVRKK